MPGRAYTTLFELAADRYGYVTQEDAVAEGFTPQALDAMARRGVAERVAWGLYRFTMFPPVRLAQYMEATLWTRPAAGVLSHDTALDLHDLCDVNPGKLHVTVPPRWRTTSAIAPSSFIAIDVPVGLEGDAMTMPRTSEVHALATIAASGWNPVAAVTSRARGEASNIETK